MNREFFRLKQISPDNLRSKGKRKSGAKGRTIEVAGARKTSSKAKKRERRTRTSDSLGFDAGKGPLTEGMDPYDQEGIVQKFDSTALNFLQIGET